MFGRGRMGRFRLGKHLDFVPFLAVLAQMFIANQNVTVEAYVRRQFLLANLLVRVAELASLKPFVRATARRSASPALHSTWFVTTASAWQPQTRQRPVTHTPNLSSQPPHTL